MNKIELSKLPDGSFYIWYNGYNYKYVNEEDKAKIVKLLNECIQYLTKSV